MLGQEIVSVFVRLKYWEASRLNVLMIASGLRKVLYVWGTAALMMLGLSALLLFKPSTHAEWADMLRNTNSLKWAFGTPIIMVFGLSLLSASNLMKNEIARRGVKYEFSDAGIHMETSVSKSDLVWEAIHRVTGLSAEFLVFTNPKVPFAIPKRCFENAHEVSALRELFRSHAKKSDLRRT